MFYIRQTVMLNVQSFILHTGKMKGNKLVLDVFCMIPSGREDI